jgi:hypothetical protein
MMNPDELRQRAAHFRLLAMDGEDLHLVAALHELAGEFDAEAANVAAREDTSGGWHSPSGLSLPAQSI